MKKKSLRNVISIITMVIMLLSTLGIGVYATEEGVNSDPQVGAQSLEDETLDAAGETQEESLRAVNCQVTFMFKGVGETEFSQYGDAKVVEQGQPLEDVPSIDSPYTDPESGVEYNFSGWCSNEDCTVAANFTEIQESMVVYGKYIEVQKATIHYDKGDVDSATVPADQTVAVGELVTLGKATSTGNIFVNWKDGNGVFYEGGAEIPMPEGGLNLYAQWDKGPGYLAKGVTSLSTLSGHQRIKVKWGKVTNKYYTVTQYVVYRLAPKGSAKDAGNWKPYATIKVNKDGTIASKTGNAFNSSYKSVKNADKGIATAGVTKKDGKITGYYFEDKDVGDGLVNYNGVMRGGTFKYKVIPQSGSIKPNKSFKTLVKGDQCVRTSFVKLKFRSNKKLTSHDKKKISKTFKSGSTVYTCGFGVGKYVFVYNNHMFYLNRLNAKGQKNLTNRKNNYTKAEAEYFVNSRGNKSKSKYLIWVNTYCQKLYLFTGSKGKWKCKYVWKVSTGQAKTPTIRYIDPKNKNLDSGRIVAKSKSIEKKLRSRHGIPWWNCFSTFNAIHGQRSGWKIDSIPRSGGCIRNTNAHAKWVYKNCKKGTCVLVF